MILLSGAEHHDKRHPNHLHVALAEALVDSDNPHLPRACSRPDGEPGDGAVNHNPIQSDVTKLLGGSMAMVP